MKRKLVVMSADALVGEDIALLREMPEVSEFFAGAAGVEALRSVYPSVTYPAHATMASGRYPDRHGVTDNNELHVGMRGEMPWNWFHSAFRGDDLFSAAKRAGLSTAAVFWPVTGCHPDIDYLVPEYWPQGEGDTIREAFARGGSSERVLRDTVDRHLPQLKIRIHPETDRFVVECACDMLRLYKPDLLMLHPANVDGYRHRSGLFGPAVDKGVRETGLWLAELMQASREAGTFEETTFVLMSDHGQLDIKRVLCPNVILADEGFLTVGEDGGLSDWQAYVHSTGLSAQVFLRDPGDEALKSRVGALLRHMADEGIYGFTRVFSAEEAEKEERLAGGFSFVLETDGFTAFSDAWARPLVRTFDLSDYRTGHATHGHLPDKGPQPVFYAFGPAAKPGVLLEKRRLVDAAPTMAAMLGVALSEADGEAATELLA